VNKLAADWIPFLSSTEIFRDISKAALPDLAAQVEEIEFGAGETLFHQGDPSDAMYLVLAGQVGIWHSGHKHTEKLLAELGPSHTVGEFALWNGGDRWSTVRAVSTVRAAKLTREGFERFAKGHPEEVEAFDRFVGRQQRRNRLSVALGVSKMFSGLPEAALRDLETQLESVWVEAGSPLFREGDVGDALYLVVSGALRVSLNMPGEDSRVLAELGCGDTAGEMALLDGEPRSATVTATRDSHLVRLSKDAFHRILSRHPDLLAVIARKVVTRLRAEQGARGRPAPLSTIIAVVPASQGIPIEDFCARLADTLSVQSPTQVVGSALIDAWLGKPGAAQVSEFHARDGRIIELLSNLETDHRYLIYQTDPSDSTWSRRCLRQCDHILIVADAARNPREGAEAYVTSALNDRRGRQASLALLHPASVIVPTGTSAWLAAWKVDRHYHLRPDSNSDFGRMARSLTGRAIGLVLSGGGVRGAGHAGVIRALREAGVPIDIVGGTSAGASMAGAVAQERDYEAMLQAIGNAFGTMQNDWTIPLVSLLSGRRFDDCFYTFCGDTQIEDLWLPLFCVSANLTRARIQVHRRGSLLKSLLASMRAPAVYPPILWDGDLLVDGGIIDNVPVDIMRGYEGCGTVIASDVSSEGHMCDADYGDRISGWQALAQRFKPASKRIHFPGILSILMRIIELSSASRKSETSKMADLYLSPPVEQFGITDFHRANEMAEASYRYASEKIADWLASSPVPDAVGTARRESIPT
jgi:predicted acylesterase/phospholipase RssA/CRP-like cAMP-binding protein